MLEAPVTERYSSYNYIKGVNISLVPAERMRYVGHNKHLRNIIYATIGHDGYLYMKSHNPQFKYMNRAKLTGVFEDVVAASYMVCDHELNLWDRVFAIEDALVNPLVEAVVKEMVGTANALYQTLATHIPVKNA